MKGTQDFAYMDQFRKDDLEKVFKEQQRNLDEQFQNGQNVQDDIYEQ